MGDEEEKAAFTQEAAEDKKRYQRELEEMSREDPEGYELYMASNKRKKKEGSGEPKEKKKREKKTPTKKRPRDTGSDSDGSVGEIKSDDDLVTKKEEDFFDNLIADLKPKRKRKGDVNVDEQKNLAHDFVVKMNMAVARDIELHENKQ